MFNLSKKREDRFIVGNGIGGYGAIKAGLNASNIFSIAASLNGNIDIQKIYNNLDKGMAYDIFGDIKDLKGSVNDIFSYSKDIDKQTMLKIFISCEEDNKFFNDNIKLKDYIKKLNFDVAFQNIKCDAKDDYLDEALKNLIKWLPID
jgi:S-formylglutathione hydrolase FrmB